MNKRLCPLLNVGKKGKRKKNRKEKKRLAAPSRRVHLAAGIELVVTLNVVGEAKVVVVDRLRVVLSELDRLAGQEARVLVLCAALGAVEENGRRNEDEDTDDDRTNGPVGEHIRQGGRLGLAVVASEAIVTHVARAARPSRVAGAQTGPCLAR